MILGLKRLMAPLRKVNSLQQSTSLCQVTVSLYIVNNSQYEFRTGSCLARVEEVWKVGDACKGLLTQGSFVAVLNHTRKLAAISARICP